MKIAILKAKQLVLDIKDDDFQLAVTDTDIELMPWSGDPPIIGQIWTGSEFVDSWQIMPDEQKLDMIRSKRGALLLESDYVISRHIEQTNLQIPTTMTQVEYNAVMSYRQALRDFPETVDLSVASFEDITWPTKPNFI